MPDSNERTEAILKRLEAQIGNEYATAYKGISKKLKSYLKQFEDEDVKQKERLDSGEITKKEYQDWRVRRILLNKNWEDRREALAVEMHHVNQTAYRTARSQMPEVFSMNANYAAYEIEQEYGVDTRFALYNHEAAELLMGEDRRMLPAPSKRKALELWEDPDVAWNQKQVQSAVLQGILQGESMDAVAKHLMKVTEMNYHAAIRNARTMTTYAQNAGRDEAYHQIDENGTEMTIVWLSTLDDRTRHEHRQMHGEVKEGEYFSNGLRFPGDPLGDPSEVYNCRCQERGFIKGMEEIPTYSPKMGDQTFEEWLHEKASNSGENFTSDNENGIVNLRGFADRNMSGDYRTSPHHILTDDEIKSVYDDADALGVPHSVLSFNTGAKTGYDDFTGLINIRGDIIPSSFAEGKTLTQRAALAHEYYGHYLTRGTTLRPGDWRDEFRASYRAAKYAPGLSDEDRQMLMRDALERASNAGVTIKQTPEVRRLLYGINSE